MAVRKCNFHLWTRYFPNSTTECNEKVEPPQLGYTKMHKGCGSGGYTWLCSKHKEMIASFLESDGYTVSGQNEVKCQHCNGTGKILEGE